MGRRAIVLLVALILAGLAGWAIWNFLQNVEEEARQGQEIVTVFRAGPGGIAEGDEGDNLLNAFNADARCNDDEAEGVAVSNCPIVRSIDQQQNAPVGVIDSAEALREILAGTVAAGPIAEGSILTANQWVELATLTAPLSEQIPSGMQALTVSTGAVQGVNGFIQAGDRINMIITLDMPAELIPLDFPGVIIPPQTEEDPFVPGGEPTAILSYTRYVLQGIPVLAVGHEIRPEDTDDMTGQIPAEPDDEEGPFTGNPTVFTLEVTPEDAERIVHAFGTGQIWLTLVPEDFVEVTTQGVILNNLFGGDLVDDIFGN